MSFPLPSNLTKDDYSSDRHWLTERATSGFTILINYTRRGPEFLDSTFAKGWQSEYDANNYQMKDPILLKSVLWPGDRRWSSIDERDKLGKVRKAALKYGLNYGATFSRSFGKGVCLLSVSRPDRENTEEEIIEISRWFDAFLRRVSIDFGLSDTEIKILQALSDDYSLTEIADKFEMSDSAAKRLAKQCRQKIGCRTNTRAVKLALNMKLIA